MNAYQEGAEAAREGKGAKDNPYVFGPLAYLADSWWHGMCHEAARLRTLGDGETKP